MDNRIRKFLDFTFITTWSNVAFYGSITTGILGILLLTASIILTTWYFWKKNDNK